MFSFKSLSLFVTFLVVGAQAEEHVINFINKCGGQTAPRIVQNGATLFESAIVNTYRHTGSLPGAIIYLQDTAPGARRCGLNGEGCVQISTTMNGAGAWTSISLQKPHEFNKPTSFRYLTPGCEAGRVECKEANCGNVFRQGTPQEYEFALKSCPKADVALEITFC